MSIPEKICQAICHLELFSEQFVDQVMKLTDLANPQLHQALQDQLSGWKHILTQDANPEDSAMICLWSELLDTLKQYEETVTEAVAETIHVHLPKALSAASHAHAHGHGHAHAQANIMTHALLKAKQCLDEADSSSLDLTSDLMQLVEQLKAFHRHLPLSPHLDYPALLAIEDFTTEALYDLGLSLDDIVNEIDYLGK